METAASVVTVYTSGYGGCCQEARETVGHGMMITRGACASSSLGDGELGLDAWLRRNRHCLVRTACADYLGGSMIACIYDYI